MYVKKKLLSVLVLAGMIANTANAAIINEPLQEEKVSEESKKITVSGTIPLSGDANPVERTVTLEVLSKEASEQILNSDAENKYDIIDEYSIDMDKIEYIAQTEADENGNYSFDYIKDSESGNYIIRIGYYTKNDENEYVITYNYKSPKDLTDMFNVIGEAYSGKNAAALGDALDKYSDLTVINIEGWNELNAEGADVAEKNFVLEYMLNNPVPESEEKIAEYIDEGRLIFKFHQKSADEIKNMLAAEENRKSLGINENVYAYLVAEDNADIQSSVYSALAGKSMSNMSVADAAEFIHKTIVFEEINNNLWQGVLEVLEKNNDILGIDFSEDGAFKKLTPESKQSEVIMAFKNAAGSLKELADVKKLFDEETAKAAGSDDDDEKENNKGNSHTNSRPTGGGTDYIASYPSSNVNNTKNENTGTGENQSGEPVKSSYNDIESVGWASEAIERLTEKGIISGDGNGNFRPQSAVTREEFLKMVIEGLGLANTEEKVSFKDADPNAWYYKYVCGGVYYKLVNGIDEETFGVGRNIKRADVAVILVRVLEMYGKEYTKKDIVYKDVLKDEIGYAYDAIYVVSEAKLMNGTSGVTFEPNRSITRAEAAVVVDRVMTLLENN